MASDPARHSLLDAQACVCVRLQSSPDTQPWSPPVADACQSLYAIANHALAVLVSLAGVYSLRQALLDLGTPVVLLANAASGSRAVRRRRIIRRDASSSHDPSSTSSDEDDADWEDEDHEGLSLRRLRYGSEIALMQLVDLRAANVQSTALDNLDFGEEMGEANGMFSRMSMVSDLDAESVVSTATRRRKPRLRQAQLTLLRKNKVCLPAVGGCSFGITSCFSCGA